MSTGTQTEVVMPQMGVSVSEGTVTRWLKQQGEAVALDEALLEISTDKVDTEVPSPGAGIVAQILVPEGTTVEVGTVLAVITPDGAATAAPEVIPPPAEPARPAAEHEPAPEPIVAATEPLPMAPPVAPAPVAAPAAEGDGRTFVSPVVARIAGEHGVDPSVVPGTGQGGRVTKKDILAFIESGASTAVPAEAPVAATPPAPEAAPAPVPLPLAPEAPAPAAVPVPAAPVAAAPPTPPPPAPPAPGRADAGRRTRASATSGSGRRARAGRGGRADHGDAPRRDGAHAPLARHVRARDERNRGRHVAGGGDP